MLKSTLPLVIDNLTPAVLDGWLVIHIYRGLQGARVRMLPFYQLEYL